MAICVACNCRDKVSSYCANCEVSFCDDCWDKQPAHKSKKHTKADGDRWEKLREILDPPTDLHRLAALHGQDQDTKWFGVKKDRKGGSKFEDTGRYANLMTESGQFSTTARYPQLVAFIGDTSMLRLLEPPVAHVKHRCGQKYIGKNSGFTRTGGCEHSVQRVSFSRRRIDQQ
jgi:hypothetical protein